MAKKDDGVKSLYPKPTFVSYANAMKVEQGMLDEFLRDAHEYRVWLKTPRVRFWTWISDRVMAFSNVIERVADRLEPKMREK